MINWKSLCILFILVCMSYAAKDTVEVPVNSDYTVKQDWNPGVDSSLAAGDTVIFQNGNGTNINVPYVGLMAGDDGMVYFKTVTGVLDSQYIVSGGYHQIYMNTIYPESSGLGIHVKLGDR